MEEFLSIQGSSQQQSQISIRSLNDVRDNVNGLGSTEGILVREPVLGSVSHGDLVPEAFSNTG
jgi:hypothetical protein